MDELTLECAYLGGHDESAPSQPVPGQLLVREAEVIFEIFGGEYGPERLFTLSWADVTTWTVDGSNAAGERLSSGRVVAGALLAGAAGALLGSLSKRAEYQAVLLIATSNRDRIGFAVKGLPSVALEAALRRFPAAVPLEGQSADGRLAAPTSWRYVTAGLDELDQLGADGWAAVGVWSESAGPSVLLKLATTSR